MNDRRSGTDIDQWNAAAAQLQAEQERLRRSGHGSEPPSRSKGQGLRTLAFAAAVGAGGAGAGAGVVWLDPEIRGRLEAVRLQDQRLAAQEREDDRHAARITALEAEVARLRERLARARGSDSRDP